MLRDMFKKTYTKIDTRYRAPEAEQTEKQEEEPGIPAGMWRKCVVLSVRCVSGPVCRMLTIMTMRLNLELL